MTSEATPYGTDAHPEVSDISDLTEGLLSVSHAQQVRAHLVDCSLCAEVHEALREIRGTLGTLPGPVRMPDDVAGRIDAALAAEALLETQRPSSVSRETTPAAPSTVSRETDAETVAGPSPATGHPAGHPTGTTRPSGSTRPGGRGPGSRGPGRQTGRRSRRLRPLLTAAGALGALVLGGALFQGLGGGPGPSPSQTDAQERSGGAAGAVAGDENLARRVQTLLEEQPATSPSGRPPDTAQPEATAPLLGGPTTVPSCVRAGIGRPEQPLAAEAGKSYAGHPSYLVVMPHPGEPQRVDAYVVDSSCTTEAGSGPGEVLFHRSYPRE